MKKTLLLTFIILCVATIVFASGTQEKSNSQEGEPIVLQWWSWDPTMKEQNEALIEKFEMENPGVTVELSTYSTSEYWTKIRIQANQNKLPDVFTMSSGYLEEWANANLLMNLDNFIAQENIFDNFYKSIFDVGKSISGTDHYYALPFALVTTVLYYNKDAFDAQNIEYPSDDWSWNDFRTAAKKLTLDKDNDGNIDQWGFWFYGRYAQVEPWVFANNGNFLNTETTRFAPDEGADEALRMLTDLVVVDKSAPQPKVMSAVRQQDVFPQQLAAMWVDGSWMIHNNRLVAESDFNWGIAQVPLGPRGTTRVTYGWPDYYTLSPNTKHPEMAWKFAKFIAGEGLSMDMYMAGKIPSYISLAQSDEAVDPSKQPAEMALLNEQAAGDMKTSFTLGWSEWRGYAAAETLGLNGLIDAILDGDMNYDEAMKKGTVGINAVLSRYYK